MQCATLLNFANTWFIFPSMMITKQMEDAAVVGPTSPTAEEEGKGGIGGGDEVLQGSPHGGGGQAHESTISVVMQGELEEGKSMMPLPPTTSTTTAAAIAASPTIKSSAAVPFSPLTPVTPDPSPSKKRSVSYQRGRMSELTEGEFQVRFGVNEWGMKIQLVCVFC